MKVSQDVLIKMKSDIEVILNHYNLINIKYEDFSTTDIFNIWSIVYANRKYNENNSNVIFTSNDVRLLERDLTFEWYPCDTNDNSLETALRKVLKEILN